MRAYGIRIPVVLTAMASVLLILFGAQFFYSRQAVQPLFALYHDVPSVQHVAVQNTSNGVNVRVRLALVPNLAATYADIEREIGGVLGNQHYKIQLVDKRTPQLVSDYYKLNNIVQQGITTGQFVAMDKAVASAGKALGLDHVSAIVDNRYVYVELVQGSNYLYQLVPRDAPTSVNASGTGGA